MKTKHIFILVVGVLCVLNLKAQTKQLDSLKKVAATSKKDTSKADILIELSKRYRYMSTDSAKKYGREALSLSREVKYKAGECRAYSLLGSAHLIEEKDSLALFYYSKGLKIAQKADLDLDRASILSNMGAVCINMRMYDSAIQFFEKALKIDKKYNNHRGVASRYSNIATIYVYQNNYKRAAEYMFKSIEFLKKEGDKLGVAMVYNNLAIIYQDQEEYKKSNAYLKKSEKIFLEEKQVGLLKIVYINLGDNYISLGDNENGIKYLKKSIEYGGKSQTPCTNQNSLYSLAKVYSVSDKVDSAEIIVKQLIKNKEICKSDLIIIIDAYLLLSEIEYKKGAYTEALSHAFEAYNILQQENEVSYKSEKAFTTKLIAKIYTQQKNYKQALRYTNIYHQTQDSILNESNIKALAVKEAEHNFELEKSAIDAKNKEDALVLENKVQQQKKIRDILILLGIITLILMVVFYRISLARKKANKELKEKNTLIVKQKEKIEENNKELVQLSEHKEFFTQMIAHDLKNPLNIINVLSSLEPTQQNLKHINQASSQMFSLVSNMLDVRKYENQGFSVQKNTYLLHNIIKEAIDRSTFILQTKSITVKTDIPQNLAIEIDKETIVRVYENLIVNAAKYSASGKEIKIVAKLNTNAKSAEIKVIDNGYGIDSMSIPLIFDKYWQVSSKDNKVSASTGLGLAFCKLVIEEHGGKINVESEINKGSTFTIILPNAHLSDDTVVPSEDFESVKDEILPSRYKNEQNVIASFKKLKILKVFQAGEISEQLNILEKYKISEVWKSKVLTTVFNGDQNEYNKLLETV